MSTEGTGKGIEDVAEASFADLDRFCAHWQSLPRADGLLMPHLRDFLDNVDPALQPHVALVDIPDDGDWSLRLYGTGRMNAFGRDLSGVNPLIVYDEKIRPLVVDSVAQVLAHPCGWKTIREISTLSGLANRGASISLPLATDADSPKCIVNYTNLVEPVAHRDRQGRVDLISEWEWMDIGAGVPES